MSRPSLLLANALWGCLLGLGPKHQLEAFDFHLTSTPLESCTYFPLATQVFRAHVNSPCLSHFPSYQHCLPSRCSPRAPSTICAFPRPLPHHSTTLCTGRCPQSCESPPAPSQAIPLLAFLFPLFPSGPFPLTCQDGRISYLYHSLPALLGKREDNIGWFKILRTRETIDQRVPAGLA